MNSEYLLDFYKESFAKRKLFFREFVLVENKIENVYILVKMKDDIWNQKKIIVKIYKKDIKQMKCLVTLLKAIVLY